jgi:hypothetical protein
VRLGPAGPKAQVHRLVLLAFVGEPPSPKHDGYHVDGDVSNNRLENLRWGTHADCMSVNRGEHNAAHKLTQEQVLAIAAAIDAGEPPGVLAKRFGISESCISAVARGETWAWATGRAGRQPRT